MLPIRRNRARDAANIELEKARARLQRAEEQQLLRVPVEAVLAEVGELLDRPHAFLRIDWGVGLRSEAGVSGLARDIGRFSEDVREVIDAHRTLAGQRANIQPEPSPDELTAAAAAVTAAGIAAGSSVEDVRNARVALDAGQRASAEMARLAAAAIPLLSTVCPVCGQAIDPERVGQELRSHAGTSETLMQLQGVLDVALRRQADAAADHRMAVELAESLTSTVADWSALRDRQARLEQAVASLSVEGRRVGVAALSVDALAAAAPELFDFLATARRRLLEAADVFAQSSTTGLVERSGAEVRSFEGALAAHDARFKELSQRAGLARNLANASIEARVEVTEQRFRAIQPLVADIFSRLDPHPAFKTIEFELDTYYKKGTTTPLVRDVVEDIRADPLVIFSTSQANIAALSYFLAIGWTAGKRSMPFVLLDDPLQSMDDVNVLGFADLCRHVRSSRQLLIPPCCVRENWTRPAGASPCPGPFRPTGSGHAPVGSPRGMGSGTSAVWFGTGDPSVGLPRTTMGLCPS